MKLGEGIQSLLPLESTGRCLLVLKSLVKISDTQHSFQKKNISIAKL